MHDQGQDFHKMVANHLLLAGMVVCAVGGVALVFSGPGNRLVGMGLILIALLAGLAFISGSLGRLHAHEHNGPQTDGLTIRWAGWYDLLVNAIMAGRERELREATLDLAAIRPGEVVVDVGCGTGSLAIAAARRTGGQASLHGLDAAVEMVEMARLKASQAGVTVDFRPGVAEALDFPDASVDLVLNSLVMHHLPRDVQVRAFAEVLRVLKPGGRLLLVEFEPPKSGVRKGFFSLLLPGMMKIDNSSLPAQLLSAGFALSDQGITGRGLAAYFLAVKAG